MAFFLALTATAHAIPATLAPEGAGLRPQAAPANQTWTPEELEKLRQPMKDLKAAAQQFLWAKPRNDKDFEHFAALLRKTVVPIGPNNQVEYDLRPRMLISEGCSGSSFAIDMIREMVKAHVDHIDRTYNGELFKCEKNPECVGGNEAMGMKVAVAKAVVDGHIVIAKEQGSNNPETRQAMHQMGAYPVMAYRSNVLAKMLCEAKDCFTTPATHGLTKRVGPNPDACFPQRRHLPGDQQTKVWIDPAGGKLVKALRSYEKEKDNMVHTLSAAGYAASTYSIVTLESLFESEGDASDTAYKRTISAWETTLSSLGVKPDRAIIESIHAPHRGARPPAAAYESIDNAAEIAGALAQAGEEHYVSMAHLLSAHVLSGLAHGADGTDE
jgi:hypothetical protein